MGGEQVQDSDPHYCFKQRWYVTFTPEMRVVLNSLTSTGWKAPRHSAKLVYPKGMATSASDEEINTSFHPTPNYAGLAEAAAGASVLRTSKSEESNSWMKGEQASTVRELREALIDATNRVSREEKGMLIEAFY